MKLYKKILLLSLIALSSSFSQQVKGLSGWNIYLDPGHSQNENVGIYNYSEAKKNLRVALALRDMLLKQTDIDTVYICRTDDQMNVDLSQRSDEANHLGAAWFHSIHSDAGDPNSNSTLVLYGEIRQNGVLMEKIPNGGKAMSTIIADLLTKAMRTSTRGAIGDLTFYDSPNSYPYLSVNRLGNMPTELSEAGFHTNPTQNQLNMNAEWKKLEAQALFWSILKFKNAERPKVGICTGIVSDKESGIPVNGAKITVGGKSYTTDTYQSLFKNYSTDSTQLHNGFYYIEGLTNDSLTITVDAPGYYSYSSKVFVVDSFFTFKDVQLVSSLSPVATVTKADSIYPGKDNITVTFSRPMNIQTVNSNISCKPAAALSFIWEDGNRKLTIVTDSLKVSTNYTITISGNSKDQYDHLFDGNKDGNGGDSLSFAFITKAKDTYAPAIVSSFPAASVSGIELLPVVNIQFDELVSEPSVTGKIKLQRVADQSFVNGTLQAYDVNARTVVNFFPSNQLLPNEDYKVIVSSGIQDVHGNAIASDKVISFKTGSFAYQATLIDNFESTPANNWWQPQASGSTVGIITKSTSMTTANVYPNPLCIGSASMVINYGWDAAATQWLIREYLNSGAPKDVRFNNTYLVQAYVFGDGNNNKFRFCLDDALGHEVSQWYKVDWTGWKLVSWDLAKDTLGTWIGDGKLDGILNLESLQFTYNPGSPAIGKYYFDDIRIVKKVTVGVEKQDGIVPDRFAMEQNYPNPFNPSTTISYQLPQSSFVTLKIYDILGKEVATLVNENQAAGKYNINFNANSLTSGIYIYKISAGSFSVSKKMMLMK
ncbi:MAG: Ig-like domain-containing protein [Bacteroidota bacterium]|nr:Ig-like domain-containing protein [Bacteroidota bacterium]